MTPVDDNWTAGDAYEGYMGRWSRPLARRFVEWLDPRHGADWLEVGCGTGALTSAICELAEPTSMVACDPSDSFVAHARRAISDRRVSFVVAGSDALPGGPGAFDCVASGLVLNLVADPARAVGLMKDRLRRGGTLAAYVWDYRGGIEFLRALWDEAVALDAAAAELDEGRRFTICNPESLTALLAGAGLQKVAVTSLQIPTLFRDFGDFWTPLQGGTGPAPAYVASLSEAKRSALRARLARRLKAESSGGIRLTARAWGVRGEASGSDFG